MSQLTGILELYGCGVGVVRQARVVTQHKARSNRLAAGYAWALAALTASPWARAHYDRRRVFHGRHGWHGRGPHWRAVPGLTRWGQWSVHSSRARVVLMPDRAVQGTSEAPASGTSPERGEADAGCLQRRANFEGKRGSARRIPVYA